VAGWRLAPEAQATNSSPTDPGSRRGELFELCERCDGTLKPPIRHADG
jgi:hypothetical protein